MSILGFILKSITTVALILFVIGAPTQKNYMPSKENLKAWKWSQDARLVKLKYLGGEEGIAERIMHNAKIKIGAYEKLPQGLTSFEFNTEERVDMDKAAGMKYITITRLGMRYWIGV